MCQRAAVNETSYREQCTVNSKKRVGECGKQGLLNSTTGLPSGGKQELFSLGTGKGIAQTAMCSVHFA